MTTVAGRPVGTPRVRARPGGPGLLWRQTRHEVVAMSRVPITLILSIGLPLIFFVILAALVGNEVVDPSTGTRLVQYLAPGMAAFGVVMATFSFLAVGMSEARTTGIVKRQSGTPVPQWVLVGGRMGAALVLGVTATVLVFAAGVLFYDLQVPPRSLGAIALTLVLASACFSALGLALGLALPTMQMTLAVSNGVVIPIAFISDMFMVGTTMPDWLSTVGWLFPLRHLSAAFAEALDPYGSGAGFAWEHLAVIAAWGLAGAALATWLVRRDRDAAGAAAATRTRSPGSRAADARPRNAGTPPPVSLAWSQVGHTGATLWRNWSAVFFAIAFPVVLALIIPSLNGGGDAHLGNGQLLGSFYAGTMAVYGAAVTAYVNMPEGVLTDRDTGVLKRLRATPLTAPQLLVGRVVGALAVALVTAFGIAVVAFVAFRPPWPPGLPAAVLSLVVATVCFAVVGLAVVSFAKSAQAGVAMTLGTLLPLAFISDIFVVGAEFPAPIEALSWFFPLRHASAAVTSALHPELAGSGLAWDHLAALLAWTVVAALVVAWRFRWESGEASRPAERPRGRRRRGSLSG